MNIFYIDECPVQSAQWMVDKHVVKMILETAQLLSTAHRVIDGIETDGVSASGRRKKMWMLRDERENILYQSTHINHPSAIWARDTLCNYQWLWKHLKALCEEYTHRYGKVHKVESSGLMNCLRQPPEYIKKHYMTKMPSAMDEEYKISSNPIKNYRNYYKFGKASLHKWTNRQQPEWI